MLLRDLVPFWLDPFLRWQTLGGSTSHPGPGFLCLDDRHLERRWENCARIWNFKQRRILPVFVHLQILRVLYILVNVHRKLWKDPPFLMGKLTINGMFNNKFSAWWLTYPSEKWWSESQFVTGVMTFPTEWNSHNPFMFQTPPSSYECSCPEWGCHGVTP